MACSRTAEYPTLSGTAVPRDFVEFPSQFNEHWATYPTVFSHYAKHYKTGAPMPAELADKIKKAANLQPGLRAHRSAGRRANSICSGTLFRPARRCRILMHSRTEALKKTHLSLSAVPPRYRSTYFAHIWGGDYGAGYYAYLWAEMLDDDAFQWFEDHGGLTRANGDRFRRMVLSRGNTEDLANLYKAWLGAEPSIEPMLKYRGLTQAGDLN